MPRTPYLAISLAAALLGACIEPSEVDYTQLGPTRLETQLTHLRDANGRYVVFHGINVSGSTKAPIVDVYGNAQYLAEPFPIEEADVELTKIRNSGFNVLRLLLQWEAIEPNARGDYDEAYLAQVRGVVERANALGIYVLLDMHQDMFSRHLFVEYNNAPAAEPGTVEYSLLSLTKPYNDRVAGDGAPRWAVEACLQEKNLDSPHWGTPRVLSGLDGDSLTAIYRLYQRLTGAGDGSSGPIPEWVSQFIFGLPGEFPVNETNDALPFTHWGSSHALSLDVARCYACLWAGDKVFPGLEVDGQNVKDYLQDAYAAAWAQVAARVADLPNVVGYDVVNEPSGNYLVLTAVGALLKSGLPDAARGVLEDLLGIEDGGDLYEALVALRVLPPDTQPETLALWGLDKLDVTAALNLNNGFAETYGRPFYERVGQAILAEDPEAVIWIEDMMSAGTLLGSAAGGVGGMWENPLTRPEGIPRLVFAPHWYPDIYPNLGFNTGPRSFTPEEVRYRSEEYQTSIEGASYLAGYSLGRPPVVYGEFGTYWNYNGIESSVASDYLVSAYILNNYYEAFERMFASNMVWCYSHRNDHFWGDYWNHEDFSLFGPDGQPRGELAWSRPYARALAGKPISTYFNSDFHYYDPDKGVPVPLHEFEVHYASKETDAPTEIFVPDVQYPEGFYVWLSDGRCAFDPETRVLYHYPERDEPGIEHWVRLQAPLADAEAAGWDYFIDGAYILGGH